MFFPASTLLSLSIPYYLSSSISPAASIPFEESRGNTTETFLKNKKKQKQNMFPQIPHPTPLLGHVLLPCSSVPPPCLKRRKGEERVEGCNSSEHKVTVQKWTELKWGGGGRSLTRREQHNLINTNARSKLFKRASNSALTCSRKATDGWTSERRWDAITCGATAHTHAHSHTRRSKREGWCLWW